MKTSMQGLISALSISIVILLSASVSAQVTQEHHRSSESPLQVEEIASQEIQLLLPQSKPGLVFQDNEMRVFDRLNYNMLLDIFLVEDEHRELFAMADAHLADSIRLEGKLFHYLDGHGFYEYIAGNDHEGVYRKHRVDVDAETVALGAYGTANRTSSIDVVRSMVDPSGADIAERTVEVENPSGQEIHLTLKREEVFHFLRDGEPHAVHSQRSLNRAFPEHRSEIRRFLRDHSINFENREDMIRLSEFVYSLQD